MHGFKGGCDLLHVMKNQSTDTLTATRAHCFLRPCEALIMQQQLLASSLAFCVMAHLGAAMVLHGVTWFSAWHVQRSDMRLASMQLCYVPCWCGQLTALVSWSHIAQDNSTTQKQMHKVKGFRAAFLSSC